MTPRIFGIDYQFLACGDVFTQGLVHAAADLGLGYSHADWRDGGAILQIERQAPDLLFVVHGRQFSKRFGEFRQRPARTAIWLLDEPYEVDDTSRFSQQYDFAFVCDPVTLDRHRNATYLPTCYDPHIHYAGSEPRPYAVGFIGGGNRIRDRYLAALARAKFLGYVVGGTWTSPEVTRLCISRNISPRETAARYRATRIVLNVYREQHHYNRDGLVATSLNPRVYEAFACGTLVISEWRPEADRVVPEMPTFKTQAECLSLVEHYLTHPDEAEAVRLACWSRIRPHTYEARLRTVLDACGLALPTEAVA
jgi:hypothetical protein